jgi:predicted Ser/Thr protein kinase
MKPTSWEQAKDVISEALKRAPSEREQFVRDRCADAELAGEIITLLAAYRDGADFLADPTTSEESVDDDELEPGTRVGPYVIIDSIGRGGMGHVFLGSDPRLRRKVALKCVIRSLAGSGERRLRILHEARAAARVAHPNVATIHDVVEHDNRAFIVMEYVEGESLASRMKRERLPIDRVIAIGRQLASALSAAHAKGVVHRDLKPGNVHFTIDGSVKVLDFGIANAPRMATTIAPRISTFKASILTTHSVQPGTPPYMAPEQLLGRTVDERADIYSLGVVLFEMATGRRPYRETEAADLKVAVANGAPRADAGDPRVPVALADVIARALAVDVDARYHSAAEVGAALEVIEAQLKDRHVGRSELFRKSVTRVAVGMLMAPPALISLGFLNSVAYNITLARTGPFAAFGRESVVDYFYWGLRSVVAPIFYVIVTMLAVAAVKFTIRLLMLSPAVSRFIGRLRVSIAVITTKLNLDDPVVLAQALATLGIVMVGLIVWWFSDLNRAWTTASIDTSPVEWFRPLDMANPGRWQYRLVLTLLTLAFSMGLARVIALRRKHRRAHGLGGLILLAATVATMVLIADVPYRLFNYNQCERVDLGDLHCYDIGETGDEVLVYCPGASPPRNRIVKRSDPQLRRIGIVESIFRAQPSTRSGF